MIYLYPIFFLALLFNLALSIPLYILGLVLIPTMALLGRYETRPSYYFPKRIMAWSDRFMYVWGNEEDGIVAGLEYKKMPLWFRIIYWSAVRNPINNTRFLPILSCKIKPEAVRFLLKNGSGGYTEASNAGRPLLLNIEEGRDESGFPSLKSKSFYYIAYQSPLYFNVRWEGVIFNRQIRLWFGTCKIYPSDSYGLSPIDYRRFGAGSVLQFKILSKGGG